MSKRKTIFAFRRLHFEAEEIKKPRMSQPGIAAFTTRVTRRTTRQKAALLDNDNSNIVSISTKAEKKALVPSSPRKTQKAPELHESSPAKIKKPNKDEVRNQFYKDYSFIKHFACGRDRKSYFIIRYLPVYTVYNIPEITF